MSASGIAAAAASKTSHSHLHASLATLSLGALGVVFGDIGTSPLYTLRECIHAAGAPKPASPICMGFSP
jgi:KUP system potassium uptake protein